MEKYNEQDFRNFVESKIINNYFRYNSIPKEQLIDAICQFEKPSYKHLNKTIGATSLIFNRRFNLLNKPKNVAVNMWFLYLFGYKWCSKCRNIYTFNNFTLDTRNWDKLGAKCKNCVRYFQKEYYNNNKYEFFIRANKRKAIKLDAITIFYTEKDDSNIEWLRMFLESELNIKLHRDHIKSLSNGGTHDKFNWQILTAEDNLRKNNRDATIVKPVVSNKKLIMFLDRI